MGEFQEHFPATEHRFGMTEICDMSQVTSVDIDYNEMRAYA